MSIKQTLSRVCISRGNVLDSLERFVKLSGSIFPISGELGDSKQGY